MSRKRLIADLFAMFTGQAAARVLGMFTTALVLRSVSVESIGEFGAATAWLGYGAMLVQLGHTPALIRSAQTGDQSDIGRIVAWRVSAAGVLTLASAATVWMGQPFPNLGSLAPLLSLVLILNALSFDWQLAADHRFQIISRIVVISQLSGAIVAAAGYLSRWPGALVLMQLALSGTLTLAVVVEIGFSSFRSLLYTTFHSNNFRLSSLLFTRA